MSPSSEPKHDPILVLRPRSPFRLDLTVWTLRRRSRNRIDQWDGTYRRALDLGDRAVSIEVAQRGTIDEPLLEVSDLTGLTWTAAERAALEQQLIRLLGTNVDLTEFYRMAASDPRIGPLKDRMLGVKPPMFPTIFEALANAIANQQISLEVGIELLNRFTDRFGARPADTHGLIAFPDPEEILNAPLDDLRDMGFSRRKAEYLMTCAEAVVTGIITESELDTLDRAAATGALTQLRGIGRWSAEYVLLRGLGRLSVFPADDVGARNKLEHLFELPGPPDRSEIVAMMERWNPYAGMIYFHLLLDGLARNGDLRV